jgi:hypothetical protein
VHPAVESPWQESLCRCRPHRIEWNHRRALQRKRNRNGVTQMFGSVVIDVVIAMALVFFVFSLVTSGLREVVAWLASTRSKVLWRSVRELLDDPISHGLQPLYEAVAQQPSEVGAEYRSSVNASERSLRTSRDELTTPEGWSAAVDTEMSALGAALISSDGLQGPLTQARTLLKEAYREPTRMSTITDMLFPSNSTQGRPRSPVVPTIGNVTVIAESVHNGIRSFTDAVYDHPLIRQVDKTVAGTKSQLTWLESGDFSGAALDLIQAAGVERVMTDRWAEAVKDIAEAIGREEAEISAELVSALKQVEDRIVAGTVTTGAIETALVQLKTQLLTEADSDTHRKRVGRKLEALQLSLLEIEPLDLIEQGLEALENIGPVRDTVARAAAAARSAETAAVDQLSAVSANIGSWYDARMASLTVWYRKRSRFVGFVLAFLVVLGFNVDAVDLPRELWQNEAIRSALVAVAETSELDLAACTDKSTTEDVTECVEDVEAVVDELIETGLPVGWVAANDCNGRCDNPLETLWFSSGADGNWLLSGLLKLAGWMLAAAALSMGASFWFDVMRRAMGIKAATKSDDDS